MKRTRRVTHELCTRVTLRDVEGDDLSTEEVLAGSEG